MSKLQRIECYKFYRKVVLQNSKKEVGAETIDIKEQNGFLACRSCSDNTFTLQKEIEMRKAQNLPKNMIFIDLEKAFEKKPLKC